MSGNDSQDGCARVVAGVVVAIIVLVSLVPKSVWIGLGIAVAVGLVAWASYKGLSALAQRSAAEEERRRAAAEAEAAAAERRRVDAARKAKRLLVQTVGEKNATLVESAKDSVRKVRTSEAARAGWLGDVDFTADIAGITESFRKAFELRKVADQLSALDNPCADDRKILGEARAATDHLEQMAIERVKLIGKCANEAKLIDESLRNERKEARTAEQRAELHAKLSAILYGIESAPAHPLQNATADAVLARVQAYREIKNQIHSARDQVSGRSELRRDG